MLTQKNTLKPFGHVLKKLFTVRNMGILCPSIYNEAPPSPGAKAEWKWVTYLISTIEAWSPNIPEM